MITIDPRTGALGPRALHPGSRPRCSLARRLGRAASASDPSPRASPRRTSAARRGARRRAGRRRRSSARRAPCTDRSRSPSSGRRRSSAPAARDRAPATANGCRLRLPYGQLRTHRPQPMHQSSMMISIELRRRIEPTGQPTMHSGSRHERHDVATRYLSKRSPSRTSRVTPSCASAQARTH